MILFLIIISSILIYHICNNQSVRLLTLSFSSLAVYYHYVSNNIIYVIALIFLTLLFKELLYRKLIRRSILFILYICSCLLLFICGKFISNFSIVLPIGYSVVMFSGISLVIDESRYNYRFSNLETFAYLLFFPKILAGPIERSNNFITQLKKTENNQVISNIYIGFKITVFGCFIKYVLTDNLIKYAYIDFNGTNQFMSILLYAILFYFDFWAYSLIAVGISKLYGIDIMMNFNNPYSAGSFKDFWNKWNISLTSWLKDYIFIPLQKRGKTSRTTNVFIVFMVSAIWHGITLPFFIWGLTHALFNIIEKRSISVSIMKSKLYNLFVILICAFLWQTFRVTRVDELYYQFRKIFSSEIIDYTLLIILSLSILLLFIFERKWFKHYIMDIKGFKKKEILFEVGIISVMLLSLLCFNTNLNSPFHYFKY